MGESTTPALSSRSNMMKLALLSNELVKPTATNLSSGEINTQEAESATPERKKMIGQETINNENDWSKSLKQKNDWSRNYKQKK